jgi:hypothetical protein
MLGRRERRRNPILDLVREEHRILRDINNFTTYTTRIATDDVVASVMQLQDVMISFARY